MIQDDPAEAYRRKYGIGGSGGQAETPSQPDPVTSYRQKYGIQSPPPRELSDDQTSLLRAASRAARPQPAPAVEPTPSPTALLDQRSSAVDGSLPVVRVDRASSPTPTIAPPAARLDVTPEATTRPAGRSPWGGAPLATPAAPSPSSITIAPPAPIAAESLRVDPAYDPSVRQEQYEEQFSEGLANIPLREKVTHAAASVPVGAAGLASGVLSGVAVLAKSIDERMPEWAQVYGEKRAEELVTAELARWVRDTAQKMPGYSDNPDLAESLLWSQLPGALGSFGAFAGQGVLLNAARQGLGTTGAVVSATLSGAGTPYGEARAAGVSEEEARTLKSTGIGALGGAAQVFGPVSFARRFPIGRAAAGTTRPSIGRAAGLGFLEEAGAEGVGQALFNVAAKSWDPERSVWDNVGNSMLVGGLAGGIAGAGGSAIARAGGRPTPEQIMGFVKSNLAAGTDFDGSPLTDDGRSFMVSVLAEMEANPAPTPGQEIGNINDLSPSQLDSEPSSRSQNRTTVTIGGRTYDSSSPDFEQDVYGAIGAEPPRPETPAVSDAVVVGSRTGPAPQPVAAPVAAPAPVEPAQATQRPQAAPVASGAPDRVVGRTTRVLSADGRKVPATYVIGDLRNAVVSHDPFSFQPNPDFPEGAQDRRYDVDRAAQDEVVTQAANLDPEYLLDPTVTGLNGPSVWGDNGMVVSGNQRGMIVRRAAELHPAKYQAYLDAIVERAEEFGLSPADAKAAIDQIIADGGIPAMGRSMAEALPTEASELRDMMAGFNETRTKSRDVLGQAQVQANRLRESSQVLTHFQETIDPELTIRKYLDTAAGRTFWEDLIAQGVVPRAQAPQYINTRTGKINDNGKSLVERLLMATVVPDPDLVDAVPSSWINKIAKAVPALIRAETSEGWSITAPMTEALEVGIAVNESEGATVDEVVSQLSFDGTTYSPRGITLARFIAENSPTKVSAALRQWGQLAEESAKAADNTDMFGDRPTPESAFSQIFGGPAEAAPAVEAAPTPAVETVPAAEVTPDAEPAPFIDPDQDSMFGPEPVAEAAVEPTPAPAAQTPTPTPRRGPTPQVSGAMEMGPGPKLQANPIRSGDPVSVFALPASEDVDGGLEVRVYARTDGKFSVVPVDTEAGFEIDSSTEIHPTRESAEASARKMVGVTDSPTSTDPLEAKIAEMRELNARIDTLTEGTRKWDEAQKQKRALNREIVALTRESEGGTSAPEATVVPDEAIANDMTGEALWRSTLLEQDPDQVRELAEMSGVDTSGSIEQVIDRLIEAQRDGDGDDGIRHLYAGVPLILPENNLLVGAAKEVGKGGYDLILTDIIKRLDNASADPLVKEAATEGRNTVSTAATLRGKLNPLLKRILPKFGAFAIGKGFGTRYGRANAKLNEVVRMGEGKRWGMVDWMLAAENIDGRYDKLSPTERELIDDYRKFTNKTGQMLEDHKVVQMNQKTGRYQYFRNRGGAIVPVIRTSEFFDILLEGKGPEFDLMVDAHAEANGVPREEALKVFRAQSKEMRGVEQHDPAQMRRIAAEYTRQWKVSPAYIFHPTTGKPIPLREPDLNSHVRRVAELYPYRMAYIQHFGQDIPPQFEVATNAVLKHARAAGLDRESAEIVIDRLMVGDSAKEVLADMDVEVAAHGELQKAINFLAEVSDGTAPPGDDTPSLASRVNKVLKEDERAPRALLDLTRSLNGLPLEKSMWFNPGSRLNELSEGVGLMSRLMKSGLLSPTGPINIVEMLGNPLTMSGGGKLGLRDLINALKGSVPSTDRNAATLAALESAGAVDLYIRDMSYNPNRPGRSIVSQISEIPIFLPRISWWMTQRTVGRIAQSKADRMRSGEGTRGDITDLRAMFGWSQQEAEKVAKGKGTDAQYNAIVQRAAPFALGDPLHPAEHSRIEKNRYFRLAFAFTRYATMRLRTMTSYTEVFFEDMGALKTVAGSGKHTSEEWAQAAASATKLGRNVLGTTAQGAAGNLLIAFLVGGLQGLEDRVEEAKDEPWKFAGESFAFSLLAGPYGAILRNMKDSASGPVMSVVEALWPAAIIAEVWAFGNNIGRYRDRDSIEKLKEFYKRYMPVYRNVTGVATTLGLGGDPNGWMATYLFGKDAKAMETAIASYRRNMRRLDPGVLVQQTNQKSIIESMRESDDLDGEFRTRMQKANDAIISNRSPDVVADLIVEALTVDGKARSDVAGFLRGKKLLTGPLNIGGSAYNPEVRARLEDRMSRKSMEALELHDYILEAWAQSMSAN